jgi:hypothetical protein
MFNEPEMHSLKKLVQVKKMFSKKMKELLKTLTNMMLLNQALHIFLRILLVCQNGVEQL